MGKVETIAVNTAQLLDKVNADDSGLDAVGLSKINKNTELETLLANLTVPQATALVGKGVKIFKHVQEPTELVIIPAGWCVLERAQKSDQTELVFGVRKSIFIKSEIQKESYVAAMGLLEAAGSNIERMKVVEKLYGEE